MTEEQAPPAREDYDLMAFYDAELDVLMQQVSKVCQANDLPFFATFCVGFQGDKDKYITACYASSPRLPERIAEMCRYHLPEDQLKDLHQQIDKRKKPARKQRARRRKKEATHEGTNA